MRYSYVCKECKTTEERDVPVDERHSQTCSCGRALTKAFDPPTHFQNKESFGYPYYDNGLGKRIESRNHHRKVMKEMGVVRA